MPDEDARQSLACEVISCACWDWLAEDPPRPESANPHTLKAWRASRRKIAAWRDDARRFLFGDDTTDFDWLCAYGGLNPGPIREAIQSDPYLMSPKSYPAPRSLPAWMERNKAGRPKKGVDTGEKITAEEICLA
jgi:hypothetical protein